MKPKQILEAARALISSPEHWTQGTSARQKSRDPVSAQAPVADSWCSVGALDKVTACPTMDQRVHDLLMRAINFETEYFYEYNDTHTHAEVLAAFDRAIALAEAGTRADQPA